MKRKQVTIKAGMSVRVKRDDDHGIMFGAVCKVTCTGWCGEWVVCGPAISGGWGSAHKRGDIINQSVSADLLIPVKS